MKNDPCLYPRMVRDCQIEIPCIRDGRPGYKWVQGWTVEYSQHHRTIPMRYKEARLVLKEAKETHV